MQLDFIVTNRLLPGLLVPEILKCWQSKYKYDAFKQYYTQFHDVNDPIYRKDKQIMLPATDGSVDESGAAKLYTSVAYVNRIVIGLQKLIVSRKTAFTTGGDCNVHAKPVGVLETELYDAILNTWTNNKLQFKNAQLFKALISETEVCEVWFTDKDDDGEINLKCNLYYPSLGYELIPIYDGKKDLVGFGLKYKVINEIDDSEIWELKFWDKETRTTYREIAGEWYIYKEPELHKYGKIPVIYYQVEQSAWQDSQSMIDRLEELMSNFADTNDYNGSPILAAIGNVEGFMSKGERGKTVQLTGGADLKYVSWDQAPESIKLEIETLLKLVFMTLQVPDISFDSMKGLGSLSGVAMDRLLIDAHLNALDFHNGVYGEGIQRRLNFIKTALGNIFLNLKPASKFTVTPKFSLFSINSDEERIDIAQKANGGLAVMSQKESIKYVGLSDDVDTTLSEINSQEDNTITE